MDIWKSLRKSRKFWLGLFCIVQTLVFHFFDVPATVWGAIDAVVVIVINAIAKEDAALKASGRTYIPPFDHEEDHMARLIDETHRVNNI